MMFCVHGVHKEQEDMHLFGVLGAESTATDYTEIYKYSG
jgi:hypothetical protein